MWENEHKKAIIRNILVFIVLVLVTVGLFAEMLKVRRQIALEDAQLSAASSNQRQEQNDARQENLDAIRQAYDLDMETVKTYLPGIVCWGDSLTTGSSGNVSYPYTLQKYINTYLCDIYDFRSSIENAEDYSRLKWSNYKVSIPVVNMGAGQEDSATILGRAGVKPYVISQNTVIPGDIQDVTVTFTSPDGRTVSPLTAGGAGINPVTVGGVEGTLSLVAPASGWGYSSYQFARSEAGAEVSIPAGTEIIPAAVGMYTDYIHIVWLGTYDGYRAPVQLVNDVQQLLNRQTANTDRYLVIGPCTISGKWMGNGSGTLDNIDSAMLQAFGSHYVNVRKYLIEDGLRDAGISATKDDTVSLNMGLVPTTFRSNAAGADLNGVAYQLIGKLVYERMDHLGYFAEVRSELNINKTTQDILKKDPQYFEKMLKTK